MAFSFRAGTNWCHDFPKLARESGFHFNMHRRRVRVDWNRLSSIDIDRVIGERDFSTIDENVNNVVDYCLESEYDVKILDPNFVKLFRLAQLAVEYLLYCKQYLDHSVVILKDELRSKLDENSILKDELHSSEKIIKQLKDKLKERSRAIESKLSDSHGEIHKCPQCPKTFISGLFMNAHVNRRHPHLSRLGSTSPVHEQYKAETEKLHSEIKTLKERLNVTERVIRNESEKLLSSESIVSNDTREMRTSNKNEQRNHRDRDERIEEQHRRYQEEIDHLKTTLFDEIRNLRTIDRYPREKHENDDNNSGNVKEIIREQENEIKRLRQQLSAKPKSDIEDVEAKHNNHESLWQSKIDYLETRHRSDMEKLYTQLRVTQESADQMRVDYMTRLSDLERREANLESTMIQARNVSYERSLPPALHDNARPSTRDEIRETLINPSVSIEAQKNRFFIQEKQRSRERKSDYLNDKDLVDYQTDEAMPNGETLRIVNSKDRDEQITRQSSSTPMSSKNTYGASKRDEITSMNINKDQGKARKRWKVDRLDGTSLSEEIHETLRNGADTHHCSSNSYTPNEKQRAKRLDSRENSKGRIFNRDNVAKDSPSRRKIKEDTSITRDVVPDVDRRNHQFVIIRDSRENLPVVDKRNEIAVVESRTSRKNRERNESLSESEGSDSLLESESLDDSTGSQTDDNSEEEKDRRSPRPKRNTDFMKENLRDYEDESSQDTLEVFNSKLRDLGIDPEWRGIPNATFAQVMEIVRHHRNINSKKYLKFDEIRRKLLHQLARTFANKEKEGRIDHLSEQSPLGKLVTNVKSKVSKALNILEKNDGSRSTKSISTNNYPRRDKAELGKLSQDRSHGISSLTIQKEDRSSKSQHLRESISSEGSEDRLTSRPGQTLTYERYGPIARRKQMKRVFEPTTDVKHLSHSYESIKDFLKDTKNRTQQKSPYNVSGTLVTSTPQRNVDIPVGEVTAISNDAPVVRIMKEKGSLLVLSNNSPRNSKSVLKSATGGSTGSLVKKKVLFDLESADKSSEKQIDQLMYPPIERDINDRENKDTSESDYEISSICGERDQAVEKNDESLQSGKMVLLKTSQSEKIAQISKQIEQQLSIARKKPVGAVEAMFMEKFSLGNDIKESPIRATRSTTETQPDTKPQQATPTNWQYRSSRSSSLLQHSSDIKDTNLDIDIDELLQMQ